MTEYLSKKISFFSFWLMLLVVLLHSLSVQFQDCNDFLCLIQYFLSHKLSSVAVPLFFLISGYLYFLRIDIKTKIDLSFFIINNKKRMKTILLPYILWCSNLLFTNKYYIFISYLFIFSIIIILSIYIGKIIEKLFPKAYKILTGSR